MAPPNNNNNNRESLMMIKSNKIIHHNNVPRLSMGSLQRTISDVSLELTAKIAAAESGSGDSGGVLPAIAEAAEEAECECCGMREEWTAAYVGRTRAEFGGKMVCGLCAEAVGEEMARSGAHIAEAVQAHSAACSRFNRLGRAYPSLFQAQAVKEILKKTITSTNYYSRAKSLSPRDYINNNNNNNGVVLARSSSCMPAITKERPA